jgi:L-alanine-DL-glutamate epimerase-like enolase superfamily enzyme
VHARGRDFKEVEQNAKAAMQRGYRHVRVQVSVPGMATYGAAGDTARTEPRDSGAGTPTQPRAIWEPRAYLSMLPKLASYNVGIHEGNAFPEETRAVFPGCPEIKDGFMYANDAPGFGIDIDEKLAAKYPITEDASFDYRWGTTRRRDGTVIRP